LNRLFVETILETYGLYPTIIFEDDLDVKAKFIPEEDKLIMKRVSNKNTEPKDFFITVLHEAKHMLDARRLGISKFLKKYAQAGTVAVYCDKDYHDDNKWEIKAERWAHKEFNNYWVGDKKKSEGQSD
tara:strand:+ start:983 stop:1366 length:384 start_codon:yes stop_codon:yes gene_type:complete